MSEGLRFHNGDFPKVFHTKVSVQPMGDYTGRESGDCHEDLFSSILIWILYKYLYKYINLYIVYIYTSIYTYISVQLTECQQIWDTTPVLKELMSW